MLIISEDLIGRNLQSIFQLDQATVRIQRPPWELDELERTANRTQVEEQPYFTAVI